MRLFTRILFVSLFFLSSGYTAFANLDEKVTIDFRDADVRQILTVITGNINMGLVVEKSVRGQLTLKIKNTAAKDALDLVTDALGYSWEKRGNNIFVTSDSSIDKKIKVLRIHHIDAGEAAKVLRETLKGDILKGDMRISECKHIDSLVIIAGTNEMEKVMRIIGLIDRRVKK